MEHLRATGIVLFCVSVGAASVGACSATPHTDGGQGGAAATSTIASGKASSSGADVVTVASTGSGGSSNSASSGSGGAPMVCDPMGVDLQGCNCMTASATRACYPATANPKTRGVGACTDGQQTCMMENEFLPWGPCTGAITPSAENCNDNVDHDCNGKTGCDDPSCATNPVCNTACNNGDTRACYDGPPGTEGVGTCKPGTQTCVNGAWTTSCVGEVLPTQEVCNDFQDHNCNGIPSCFDFIACFGDPACQPPPCMPQGNCVCPMGSGDAATCPNGDYGDPLTGLCCPCSTSTCDQIGCCGESVCAGAAVCVGLSCQPLNPSCGGLVNVDCDFEDLQTSDVNNPPEDCDQVCCKCMPTICP